MNSDDKRKIKIGIAIAAFAIGFYYVLQNLATLRGALSFLLSVLSPFLYGVTLAFVMNLILRFFEKKVFASLNRKDRPLWRKLRRPVCLTLTVLLFFGAVTLLLVIILPSLAESCMALAGNLSGYLQSLEQLANQLLGRLGFSADLGAAVASFLGEFSDAILKVITSSVPHILETTKAITTVVMNLFLGVVIAIYMLATKESLRRHARQVGYAYLPTRLVENMGRVWSLTSERFAGFVSGQLIEALILGTMCFVGMTLFRMEYALLISAIVGLMNMVPFVGAFIGAVPGVLLMLMIDPMKAVWFLILLIVIQQIESNLIYPRIVGNSIGLPGLWVLFAVVVGGGFFGLPGVLLGVPVFAVLYTLLGDAVQVRLKTRGIKLEEKK